MRFSLRSIAVSLALAGAAACSLRDAACGKPGQQTEEPAAAPASDAAARPGGGSQRFRIVFLGDSLTAGLGILSEDAYPLVLQRKFEEEGYANVDITNASISGDTTAGGLQRVPGMLD